MITTQTEWMIKPYRSEDLAGILELNRREYGDTFLSQPAYFDWLLHKNPFGPPVIPVARENDSGAVIGFCLFVPVKFEYEGRSLPAAIGYNLLVAPEYRRQGVFSALVRNIRRAGFEAGYQFFYTFPNPRSLEGHKKWQDKIIARIPLSVRPLDIEALAAERLANPLARLGVEIGWQLGKSTAWRPRQPRGTSPYPAVQEDAAPDEVYVPFWESVKNKYRIICHRNADFLTWRFACNPAKEYLLLSARRGGQILGYLVARATQIRGSNVGLLADFQVTPGETGNRAGWALIQEMEELFRNQKLALAGGLFLPHGQEYTLLRRAGYFPAPDRFAPQSFHLVANSLNPAWPVENLLQPKDWFVSIADHDAV